MSVTSTRTILLGFSDDVNDSSLQYSAAANGASPAGDVLTTLASGANTITLPTGGATVRAVTIVPPVGNTQTMIFKGVTGDAGVGMHLTDPTSFALAASVTSFCITAGGTITGIRFIFS